MANKTANKGQKLFSWRKYKGAYGAFYCPTCNAACNEPTALRVHWTRSTQCAHNLEEWHTFVKQSSVQQESE